MVTKRSFKNFNKDDFLKEVKAIHWYDVYMEEDPDKATQIFTKKLKDLMDEHAPVKTFQVRKNYAPWLSKETESIMKERDEAQKKASSSQDLDDWRLYKNLRNIVTKNLKKDKKVWEELKLENTKNIRLQFG